MREWWNRFHGWVTGRPTVDQDLAEEVRAHLAMQAEDFAAAGMSAEAARAAAHRSFGNATLVTEQAREAWGFPAFEGFLKDVRYGFRSMRRAPAFSLVVILTFALGVGVNTAIFSVVRSVLLKPLPYPASERLVRLKESNGKSSFSVTWGNFKYWHDSNHTFEEMAAFQTVDRTLTGRGDPVVIHGLVVTAPYFSLLGATPLMGRLLGQSDDEPGAPMVAVVSRHFWSTQLNGDPNILGQTLRLNGRTFEVVGVAAPLWEAWPADFYMALGMAAGPAVNRAQHGSINALGRLKKGATLQSAIADLDAIMRNLAETDPGPENAHRSSGVFLMEDILKRSGGVRGTLLVLMGAAALILLIACANVASLVLARNTARASELAVRKAIGAGHLRVVRQLLTENIVIAAAGGAAGVAFAYAGLRLLLRVAPADIPRLAGTTVDWTVLAFACGVALAAGVMAALAPVVVAGRIHLAAAMKEGARLAGGGRQRQSIRNLLVIAEVALTFVLAFGAGLLLRSLIAAQHSNPGFDSQHLISFSVQLPAKTYKDDGAINAFYTGIVGDLKRLPGVVDASVVSCPPGAGDCGDWFYSVQGRPQPAQNEVPVALFNRADPGYFHMMRVPMLQGREFNEGDTAAGVKNVIVNATLARQQWPNEPAVGRQIKMGGPYQKGDVWDVIGVAGDVKQYGLDGSTDPEVYRPGYQEGESDRTVMVRTAGDPAGLMPAVRARVLAVDRALPLQKFGVLEELMGAGLARRRFSTLLLTLFACLAVILAAIGIYGLLSYWVSSRESEIALRLALGASPGRILRWTSFHALRLALIGVAFGVAGGWVAVRALSDLVFGIEPHNVATMAGAGIAVMAIAFFAAASPATRAARVDAARRLHHM
jgi:predicted permease